MEDCLSGGLDHIGAHVRLEPIGGLATTRRDDGQYLLQRRHRRADESITRLNEENVSLRQRIAGLESQSPRSNQQRRNLNYATTY